MLERRPQERRTGGVRIRGATVGERAVGVAELVLPTRSAATSTAPLSPTRRGICYDAVGVSDVLVATGFAQTPTAAGATARPRGTPCVAISLLPTTLLRATHDDSTDGPGVGGWMRVVGKGKLGGGRTEKIAPRLPITPRLPKARRTVARTTLLAPLSEVVTSSHATRTGEHIRTLPLT